MKLHRFSPKRLVTAAVIIGSVALTSCLDDDDKYYYAHFYPNALVTVKQDIDDTFFLQLDDSTTLLPTNMASSPFGEKEVRALVNYDQDTDGTPGKYDQAIHINWIDSILTKPLAADLGEDNDKVYGTDPVDILKDWVTVAEDGYLTLGFRTVWGNASQPHYVNLLYGRNPENPYEVEFRHNAYGDTYGQTADAIVAFRLDKLPDTEGKTVKLTLKWNSPAGEKSVDFDYCTRKAINPRPSLLTGGRKAAMPLK